MTASSTAWQSRRVGRLGLIYYLEPLGNTRLCRGSVTLSKRQYEPYCQPRVSNTYLTIRALRVGRNFPRVSKETTKYQGHLSLCCDLSVGVWRVSMRKLVSMTRIGAAFADAPSRVRSVGEICTDGHLTPTERLHARCQCQGH